MLALSPLDLTAEDDEVAASHEVAVVDAVGADILNKVAALVVAVVVVAAVVEATASFDVMLK